MSYRDGSEGYDGGRREGRQRWWPDLDSLPEALEVARKARGGWALAVGLVLGLVFALATGLRPTDMSAANDVATIVIGNLIELAFVLFASYRMTRRKGWLVSWFLLALFAAEAVGKITSGHFNIAWLVAYLYIAASILGGARACWSIRQRRRRGEHEESLGEVFA